MVIQLHHHWLLEQILHTWAQDSLQQKEANADQGYKQMLIDSAADDIVYSSLFTGVSGNYLKPSKKMQDWIQTIFLMQINLQ